MKTEAEWVDVLNRVLDTLIKEYVSDTTAGFLDTVCVFDYEGDTFGIDGVLSKRHLITLLIEEASK
jgi:hypothetical protein